GRVQACPRLGGGDRRNRRVVAGQAGLMSGGLCVVHLVRIGEPVASLERFLRGYREHEAGAEHRLVLLYKGFGGDAEALRPYRDLLAGVAHEEIEVSDEGFDL